MQHNIHQGKTSKTEHTWLSWHTSWNNDNITTLQRFTKTFVWSRGPDSWGWKRPNSLRIGRDVAEIGGHTGSANNVIAGKLANLGRKLQQQRKRLTDTPVGSEDCNFCLGRRGSVKASLRDLNCCLSETTSAKHFGSLALMSVIKMGIARMNPPVVNKSREDVLVSVRCIGSFGLIGSGR
jgi:hypothetical protein